MRIRWRFAIVGLQLILALIANKYIFDQFLINEAWFYAGILALIINPPLLEPWYSKPVEVIANTFIFLSFYVTTEVTITNSVWLCIAIYLGLSSIFAIIATIGGANKKPHKRFILAQPARILSQYASARFIYSSIFVLASFEAYQDNLPIFFDLLIFWFFITLIGYVNWQRIWEARDTDLYLCDIEGMVGPTLLNVSTTRLPVRGANILIQQNSNFIKGVVVKRIKRLTDIWGQILIFDRDISEKLVSGDLVRILSSEDDKLHVVGTVEPNSTDKKLKFISTESLRLGDVVGVSDRNNKFIIYQISHVEVKQITTKGGAHYSALVTAIQLGIYDNYKHKLKKHKWIPPIGGAVVHNPDIKIRSKTKKAKDSSYFQLGRVIDTEIPIYLDLESASEGHIAILGMTKMGKSTLAVKLIKNLKKKRNVSILDQTGEYANKKGFKYCTNQTDFDNPNSYVVEPQHNEIPADKALRFFKFLINRAVQEYKKGTPKPRSIIIEEAHQFIPEPTGLGFKTPGRDSSIETGTLMMQIRKYNLSTIIISQRTAVIAKSALSQCENFIVFRSVDQTGLDYIENVAGFKFRDLVSQLEQGEALVFGPAISSDNPVVVKIDKD